MTTTQVGTKLGIRKITARIGAEITGLSPDLILDPETIAAVRAALNEHKALVFRGVRLDDEDQQRFAGYFGPLTSAHPTVPAVDGEPNVLPVDSEDTRANHWHTGRAPAAAPRHRGRRYPGRHRRQPQLFRQGRRFPLLPGRRHPRRSVNPGRGVDPRRGVTSGPARR